MKSRKDTEGSMKKIKQKISHILIAFGLLVSPMFAIPVHANPGAFFLDPSSGQVNPGTQNWAVPIYINTNGSNVSLAACVLTYPSSMMTYSKSAAFDPGLGVGSSFESFVAGQVSDGRILFTGVDTTSGNSENGSKVTVGIVYFNIAAGASGTASLNFDTSDSSCRVADESSNEIGKAGSGGNYTVGTAAPAPTPTPAPTPSPTPTPTPTPPPPDGSGGGGSTGSGSGGGSSSSGGGSTVSPAPSTGGSTSADAGAGEGSGVEPRISDTDPDGIPSSLIIGLVSIGAVILLGAGAGMFLMDHRRMGLVRPAKDVKVTGGRASKFAANGKKKSSDASKEDETISALKKFRPVESYRPNQVIEPNGDSKEDKDSL